MAILKGSDCPYKCPNKGINIGMTATSLCYREFNDQRSRNLWDTRLDGMQKTDYIKQCANITRSK